MEKVAEHINEMQRIHEEYGAIFDHLFRQHQKSCKQVSRALALSLEKESATNNMIIYLFETFSHFAYLMMTLYI